MKLYQIVTHLFTHLGNVRDFPHIIKVNFLLPFPLFLNAIALSTETDEVRTPVLI